MSTLQQGGVITPGHLAAWATNGVLQDAGTATEPLANSLGLYGNGGTPFGITNSAYAWPFTSSVLTTLGMGVSQTGAYTSVYGTQSLSYQIIVDGIVTATFGSTGVNIPTLSLSALTVGTINNVAILAPSTTSTLALANNSTLATAGANYQLTLTAIGNSNVTFPLSGTLATTAGTVTNAGAYPISLSSSGTAALTVPTSGTLATVGATVASFSGGSTGLTPATATTGAVTLAGTLAVASGGTGLTATPTNGQLLIGNGTGFTLRTLTAGANISIANTTGTITISAVTGGGTLPVGNGGTGATTLTGYVYGNGTSAVTASATIPSTAITGLDTMSTQAASNVAITGGTIALTTQLAVASGGTGATSLAANNVLLGNGTSAVQVVAPGSSGNVLLSNGTTWASTSLSSQFPSNLGSPGSVTLPGGVIMKWGQGNTSSNPATVAFATAFPTACDNITLTIASGSTPTVQNSLIVGSSISTTGFLVYCAPGANLGFFWFAIGH
jgi:hypothetical protein